MKYKKLIPIFFFVQILVGVTSSAIFAQDSEHWLKIVEVDKSVGGLLKILDNDGNEIQTIIIPNGTDAVTAGRIISREIIAYKALNCFTRVGNYLRVDNVNRYKIIGSGAPAGLKLQVVNRPDFISKVDSVIVTANPETRWKTEVLRVHSDREMYDSYTIDPVSYGPQEPPFGNPSERKTNWWEYKVGFKTDQFGAPFGVEVRCATSDAKADHFITVKLKMKKLVLKE
jgi:hypothetical protein